jgi:translation initiation factor 1
MTKQRDELYREVFSTERGQICSSCGKANKLCSCEADRRAAVIGDGNVRVRRETKGRGGKTVTTISGLAMNKDQLKELLGHLKRKSGSGGAEKDGVLEIQGDHCDGIIIELAKRGIKAKRAGG